MSGSREQDHAHGDDRSALRGRYADCPDFRIVCDRQARLHNRFIRRFGVSVDSIGRRPRTLLDAQYRAKQVSRKDCRDSGLKIATDMQRLIRNMEDDPAQAERPALAEKINARRHLFQLRTLCGG
jgi:hypothetical protein